MEIGRTFTVNGGNYVIKQITGDRIDASKIIGEGPASHIQRGRPCKFTYNQVAEALGYSVTITAPDTKTEYSETPDDEEVIRPPADPEKIKALIESFGDASSTLDDW